MTNNNYVIKQILTLLQPNRVKWTFGKLVKSYHAMLADTSVTCICTQRPPRIRQSGRQLFVFLLNFR